MRASRRKLLKSGASVLATAAMSSGSRSAWADPAYGPLERVFLSPPPEARPRVWWHWVNGNVTLEGILADLAWMKRVGLGGFTLFDAAFRSPPTPVLVQDPVIFHSSEWSRLIAATAAEAARLDLDFGVHISGGWSLTGGPWVQPHQAMKKVVWSETTIEGGQAVDLVLSTPPARPGPFMDYPASGDVPEPAFYRDIAVLAFPADVEVPPFTCTTSSGEPAPVEVLGPGGYDVAASFTVPPGEPLTLTFEYESPWLAAWATLALAPTTVTGRVEGSPDGCSYTRLADWPGPAEKGAPVRTFAFAPRTVRSIRLTIDPPPDGQVTLRRIAFGAGPRVHRFEDKSGLGTLADYGDVATPWTSGSLDPGDVLDLTDRLQPGGRLTWAAPAGRWTIQRFGYSLTGRRNVPATPAATGLEADKLNPDHVRAHLEGFFGPLLDAVGPNVGHRGLQHAIVDSWEAGQQNWTEAMAEAFAARRGYDLRRWLPALAGRVVGSAARSDRFLWDFRRTIADLLADNHYSVIRDFVHERGLVLYGESMGVDLPTVGDGLQLKGRADIPTGEFWARVGDTPPLWTHVADIREAASAAHIYGRPLVAAESFTTLDDVPAWSMGPRELKPIADRFMAEGVNRFIVHTSAHQPFNDRAPGVTLRKYGQHFSRHEAWADLADTWLSYLARSSCLLQQGQPVADIAIFYGEGAPVAAPFRESLMPVIPPGLDFDYINTERLDAATVAPDGRIVLENAADFALLWLPSHVCSVTPGFALQLQRLAASGGTIAMARPLDILVAAEEPGAGPRSASRLPGRAGDYRVGRGRVIVGASLGEAVEAIRLSTDVAGLANTPLVWKHRRWHRGDIYFFANPDGPAASVDLSLRSTGATPQMWNARDGSRLPLAAEVEDGRTRIALDLARGDAIFVVFDTRASAAPVAAEGVEREQVVSGPWRVTFKEGRGLEDRTRSLVPGSWTEIEDPGVRYFSGSAVYRTTFEGLSRRPRRVVLDLGDVRELARVILNGKVIGAAFSPPFQFDITDAVRAGENRLEVTVANYWHNRLVGDQQPGARAVAYTTIDQYSRSTPLRPSGLLGPVALRVLD